MVCAKEMGMSEKEFWNSCPVFFNECYEAYVEKRKEEMTAIYGG